MHRFRSLLAVLVSAWTCIAAAQEYPSRSIVMIAPFAAGAPVDIVGRIVAERMRMALGQPVIVENVSGAAGSVGTARVASAPNDGYTIGVGNVSSHVLNGAVYDLRFDVFRDFEPIALLASNPQLLLSRKSLPAADLQNLIVWLRANGDRVTAGTGGVGGVSHVAGVLFQRHTGTRFQFVPYRGSNLAQQDLIGGHIDLLFEQAVAAVANVRSGKVKAYAVTTNKRLRAAPEIPTVDEAGLPEFYTSVWNGLWAPRHTHKDVIAKLSGAVIAALADPIVRKRLDDIGLDIPPREEQTPAFLGAFHKAEIDKWWPVIRTAKIKAE